MLPIPLWEGLFGGIWIFVRTPWRERKELFGGSALFGGVSLFLFGINNLNMYPHDA